MAVAVITSLLPILDSNGLPYNGAKINVYAAGTTTPVLVYFDAALTQVASNPIICNSAGHHVMQYIATAVYKIFTTTADDVPILDYSADNIDPGLPIGTGTLAVVNGGTGAATAATARTNLGAASASSVTSLAGDVATLQSTVAGYPSFGTMASRNSVLAADLPVGAIVGSTQATYAGNTDLTAAIPADDTAPQIGEGVAIISTTYTPSASTNRLRIRFSGTCGCDTLGVISTAAIFKDSGADAIAAAGVISGGSGNFLPICLETEIVAGTTAAITISVRAGTSTGATLRFNGLATARRYGGTAVSYLVIEEIKV